MNLPTLIVLLVVIAIVGTAAYRMYSNKKNHRSSCGCDCGDCGCGCGCGTQDEKKG